jgi:hypothetical protein
MKSHQPEIISGKFLAIIIKLLILLEKSPGGPYYNETKKLDLKLNALIATWLALFNIHLQPLNNFLRKNKIKIKKNEARESISKPANIIYNKIARRAQKFMTTLGPDLNKLGTKALTRLLQNDTDQQILLLPLFFKKSLGHSGQLIPSKTITDLGLANLYLWLAYTIYDSIIDNERPAITIPLANIFFKEYLFLNHYIFKNYPAALSLLSQIIDAMEKANIREIHNRGIARKLKINYENHTILAEKSFAHAFSPLGLLIILGYKADSAEINYLKLFFKHYLIARQLNDDAHDWEADLKAGYFNSVSLQIAKFTAGPINYKRWRQIFWDRIFMSSQQQILKHTKRARKYLARLSLIEDKKYLRIFIEAIELGAKKSLQNQITITELTKARLL